MKNQSSPTPYDPDRLSPTATFANPTTPFPDPRSCRKWAKAFRNAAYYRRLETDGCFNAIDHAFFDLYPRPDDRDMMNDPDLTLVENFFAHFMPEADTVDESDGECPWFKKPRKRDVLRWQIALLLCAELLEDAAR
jgi:hypothetical protein